jgi:hypothetical protein
MLTRRQFLYLVASGVAADQLLPLCDPALRGEMAESLAQEVHLRKRYTPANRSYGSGSFGEWIADPHGLPCYHYTCDQTQDPAAITPVETAWRSPTDHTHQIGNDRIVAAASNYGYLQVRQDEGGPKFLNDLDPAAGRFGAGLGYLTDGRDILGTYFPGTAQSPDGGPSFERFFGTGYLRKQITGANFSVDQTIYAPFGDDPVLLSEVVVTSLAPEAANLHWVEYWGCQIYPFSLEAYDAGRTLAGRPDPVRIAKLRRDLASRFDHRFERIHGQPALLETKHRRSQKPADPGAAVQEEITANAGLLPVTPSKQPSSEVLAPPTFLASLDDGPVRFVTDAAAFFGPAGVLRHVGPAGPDSVPVPSAVLRPAGLAGFKPANGIPETLAPDDLAATGPDSALILLKPFLLEPGRSQTLRFLYGYLPRGFTATELIAKYRAKAGTAFAESCAAWKDEGIRFAVEADPWVERETRWHSYYLRSGLTYDDFFNEHILSQGQVYQYCIGYQGAARDPLQHALPLVFGEASLAKQVLRYTLKSQGPDGALPFFVTGQGRPVHGPWQASDLDLWLLWLASEYLLATRDTEFLEERLADWPLNSDKPTSTVRDRLARAYHHLGDTIGSGKHGLLRGLNDDWNDRIYREGIPANLSDEVLHESESVMNAAIAAYVLDHYARMLRYTGDLIAAKDAEARAARQRDAVRAQWAGSWFKRLWLGPTKGWLGDGQGPDARVWLDGQPWAILGGCATPDQRKTLVESIDQLLRKTSKIGAKQVGKPVDWPGFMPGEAENGGVWAALDGPLVWALAAASAADPSIPPGMAYDEWQKNSRAHHAEVYRDVWYGIWSGPDVYCSSDSDHAGQTGYDWGLTDPEANRRPNSYRGLSWTAWPVMNMHRHAWPLYSAAKLIGIEFTEKGLNLAPAVPKPQYSFRSRLVGFEKTAQGYQGWYAPLKAGSWTLRLQLPTGETSFKKLIVNETPQRVRIQPDRTVEFTGTSVPGEPLRWSLLKS